LTQSATSLSLHTGESFDRVMIRPRSGRVRTPSRTPSRTAKVPPSPLSVLTSQGLGGSDKTQREREEMQRERERLVVEEANREFASCEGTVPLSSSMLKGLEGEGEKGAERERPSTAGAQRASFVMKRDPLNSGSVSDLSRYSHSRRSTPMRRFQSQCLTATRKPASSAAKAPVPVPEAKPQRPSTAPLRHGVSFPQTHSAELSNQTSRCQTLLKGVGIDLGTDSTRVVSGGAGTVTTQQYEAFASRMLREREM
ncbi:hypothetical protein KIPB_010639, partial [Kipferlia bialata]